MTPRTEAGRLAHGTGNAVGAKRWHRPGCNNRVRDDWECTCGLLGFILAIEAAARAAGAREALKGLRDDYRRLRGYPPIVPGVIRAKGSDEVLDLIDALLPPSEPEAASCGHCHMRIWPDDPGSHERFTTGLYACDAHNTECLPTCTSDHK